MKTWIKVARYQLVQPYQYVAVTWAILALSFLMSVVIFARAPVSHHLVVAPNGFVLVPNKRSTGALSAFFMFFFVLGVRAIGRSLPFALTLGVSRRSYYTGSALLAGVLAFADGLALSLLQALERVTGGWWMHMEFFRVAYLLDGPWYQTWLTSFVGLTLLFVYGMWFGIVYRRWDIIGTIIFVTAQVTVLLAGWVIVTWAHAWPHVGHFFAGLTATGLTGLLALLALLLLAGGRATVRGATA